MENGGRGGECGPGLTSPLGAAMSSVVEAIAGAIAGQQRLWGERGRSGPGTGGGPQWLDIAPESAAPIPAVQSPRRIAFVDGGNATLFGSPGWSVGFNRVCYAVCRGERVLRPACMPRVDFMSLLVAEPGGGDGDDGDGDGGGRTENRSGVSQPRRYALRTFPVVPAAAATAAADSAASGEGEGNGGGKGASMPRLDDMCIPTDDDLGSALAVGTNGNGANPMDGGSGNSGGGRDGEAEEYDDNDNDDAAGAPPDTSRPTTDHNRSRMMSVPRAFAEWKMAAAVVGRELNKGDVLVLDGTLQTGYGGEARLAHALYDAARSRGVVVCALAKTTTLMAAGGMPVLYAAQEAARMAGHRTWYMPLARRVSGDGSGFVLAARLHRNSMFSYRLEVLRDQYDALAESGELGNVIGSIAANSGDPSFPGYPYGLVSADRHARVRGAEAAVHRRMLLGEFKRHELGRTMVDHAMLLSAHKTLNRAVGGG